MSKGEKTERRAKRYWLIFVVFKRKELKANLLIVNNKTDRQRLVS
jgi:hypothetical protein